MCSIDKTVWACRDCEFETRNEQAARAHAVRHRVHATRPDLAHRRRNGIVGVCSRCGEPFNKRADWVMHELGMRDTIHNFDHKFAKRTVLFSLEDYDALVQPFPKHDTRVGRSKHANV